jgi:P4 family phage/plasmid primase-like protien
MSDKVQKTPNPNKINAFTSTIYSILDKCRMYPGQKSKCTHVSMGGVKGKFFLAKDLRKKLYKALSDATEYGLEFHIAEVPQEYGPIIFDIDLEKKKTDYTDGRLYDNDMISEIVELYRDGIKKYLDVDESDLKVCIFEKDEPTFKEFTVRDGIHGFFNKICTSIKIRHLIRNYVVTRASESDTFSDFNKNINDIFDKQIISSAPWLMYGCRKVDGKVYKLTMVLDNDMNNFGPDSIGDQLQKTKLFSIQNKIWCEENKASLHEDYCPEMIDEEYDSLGFNKTKINIEMDENTSEIKKRMIEKAREFLTMLKESRADNYNDWIRVGWALHNVDECLIQEWIEFSQKSDKFEDGKCEELWLTMKDSGYSIRSLAFWAKEDSPDDYKHFIANEYNSYIEKSLDTNTYYIAKALHNKYSDRFVCTCLKNNEWFEFRNHKWVKTQHGTSLVNLICEDFINDFLILSAKYNNDASTEKDTTIKKNLSDKADNIKKIIAKLFNGPFKKLIMDEAKHLFYETDFVRRLDDTNKHLIGFENGIYDLETETFRAGRPDDLVSMSTKVNYVDWNLKKKDVKFYFDKMDAFFSKVLTDDEVKKYFLLSLATCCSGENKEQKFRMITGSGSSSKNGSNGKSLTMSLAAKAFGDYYVACPITIITRKRNASNAACPELARLKGTRLGVFQETDENETLNVGILKELTGNDKIMVRAMYQEPIDIQLGTKFFLQCNKLPVVNAKDHGTWRRVRVVEFGSRFVENPTKKNEFKIDNTLESEINKWAPYFISYLIHLFVTEYKQLKNNIPEPSSVTAFTDSYKNDNDSVSHFKQDCIKDIPKNSKNDKEHRKYIKEADVCAKYRIWFKKQEDKTLNILSNKEFIGQFTELVGEPKNKRKGWDTFEIIEDEYEDNCDSSNCDTSDDDITVSKSTKSTKSKVVNTCESDSEITISKSTKSKVSNKSASAAH